ncbi:MAG: hypothetical protein Q8K21_03265 [Hydrogenophaga sp.]|nr:hypothetical protein [Hydrogenophaga sp.]MDP2163232.1 hypothetical protein [Hydrogenophaga sp.]MDP3476329.1 hypothetical protein [Hydrogenophaga sp.]
MHDYKDASPWRALLKDPASLALADRVLRLEGGVLVDVAFVAGTAHP